MAHEAWSDPDFFKGLLGERVVVSVDPAGKPKIQGRRPVYSFLDEAAGREPDTSFVDELTKRLSEGLDIPKELLVPPPAIPLPTEAQMDAALEGMESVFLMGEKIKAKLADRGWTYEAAEEIAVNYVNAMLESSIHSS